METKYQLCRKVNFGNSGIGTLVTGHASLQDQLKIREEDINCYAVAAYFNDMDYPWYKCPDDQFWINGIDGEEYLHKTISIFRSKAEAAEEMKKYKGKLEIVQIFVDKESETIWLNLLLEDKNEKNY